MVKASGVSQNPTRGEQTHQGPSLQSGTNTRGNPPDTSPKLTHSLASISVSPSNDPGLVADLMLSMSPVQVSLYLAQLLSSSNVPASNTTPSDPSTNLAARPNFEERTRQMNEYMNSLTDKNAASLAVTQAEIKHELARTPEAKKAAAAQLETARQKLAEAEKSLKLIEEAVFGSDWLRPEGTPSNPEKGNGLSTPQGADPSGPSSAPLPEGPKPPLNTHTGNNVDGSPKGPDGAPKEPVPLNQPEQLATASSEPQKRFDYRYKSHDLRNEAESKEAKDFKTISPEHSKLIDALVKEAKLGDHRDVQLLKEALACIHPELLKKLNQLGYSIFASRDNVANALPDTHGREIGGSRIDDASGIHSQQGDTRSIVVVTRMQDGKLSLDFSTLMHEIGHAVSMTMYNSLEAVSGASRDWKSPAQSLPAVVSDLFKRAFSQEKSLMPRDYYRSDKEFLAETFAMYSLRPDEMRAKMPLTYKAYEALTKDLWRDSLPWPPVLFGRLLNFQANNSTQPVMEGTPRGQHLLNRVEQLNNGRRHRGLSGESHAFLVNGEEDAVRLLATAMGRDLCDLREGRPPYDGLEGCIRITQSLANEPEELFKKLAGSVGAILYVPADLNLSPASPFFQAFHQFNQANNGVCHLLISGNSQTLASFEKSFGSNTPSHNINLGVANAEQVAELVHRAALQEDYQLSDEALVALKDAIKIGGTFADGIRMWAEIKKAHINRIVNTDASDSMVVSAADVAKAGIKQEENPLDKLMALTGLSKVKDKIQGMVARARLEKSLERGSEKQNPTALVFSGNPGTGKTTVARIVAQIMAQEGVVKSPHVQMLKATELAKLGKDGATKEFLKGKNGTIFIDEFHQLDPETNRDGKAIIDLLIPMLTDPEWKNTVFVFAGYDDKIKALLRTDEGLQSRCEFVPFEDYSRDELRTIAGGMLKARKLLYDETVLQALCDRVDDLQRGSQYPGNARDVEKTIESVLNAQAMRLSKMPTSELTQDAARTILLEDVVVKREYTPEDILNEFDRKFVGNSAIRKLLVDVQKAVNTNKRKGRDPLTNVPMAILIDGEPGTGKKEMSELIVKFYHSLGLLSSPDPKSETGGNLVGAYEGNSSAMAVRRKCESALGGGLIVNQIKGMTNNRTFSESSVNELKDQLSKNGKRFLLIGIDSPENIDKFLAFDGALAGKFKRVEAERLSLAGARELFTRLAKSAGIGFEDGYQDILSERLAKIVAAPGFASGRDIQQIVNRLQSEEEYEEADGNSEHVFSNAMLTRILDDILTEVKKRPAPGRGKNPAKDDVPVATDTSVQTDRESEKDRDIRSASAKVRQAIVDVNKRYADLADKDPKAFYDMQQDPKSTYYEELGIELNITAEQAHKEMTKMLEELKEQKKVLKEQFDYVCFACRGTNSMSCAYFSQSEMAKPDGGWTFSLEWLMANSLQGPYTVEEDE